MQDIYEIFKKLEIEYKLYDHPPFYTCDESKEWYANNIEEDAGDSKNIFLRNKKGDIHYLVVIESHKRLDLKQLAEELGESSLSFASPERLKKYLNLTPGSVSVLALLYPDAKDIQVVMDKDLMEYKQLHYHPPGRNDQTIFLSTDDVKKFIEWVGNETQYQAL